MKNMLRGLTFVMAIAVLAMSGGNKAAASGGGEMKHIDWGHEGPFGTYDRGALQRGYQVYTEVCASCHSMRLLYFRNLTDIGYSEDQVKAIAAEYDVVDGPDNEGEMFERPGKPSDQFPLAFPNDNAARASNNGALPPDLSLIAKARVGGANYLYSLMIGYGEAPEDMVLADGMEYNAYFPNHQIAMPAPLDDEAVEYSDGTPATLDQHSRDVSVFLAWAAEPKLEERHRIGVKVMIFLLIMVVLTYLVKRRVWSDLH